MVTRTLKILLFAVGCSALLSVSWPATVFGKACSEKSTVLFYSCSTADCATLGFFCLTGQPQPLKLSATKVAFSSLDIKQPADKLFCWGFWGKNIVTHDQLLSSKPTITIEAERASCTEAVSIALSQGKPIDGYYKLSGTLICWNGIPASEYAFNTCPNEEKDVPDCADGEVYDEDSEECIPDEYEDDDADDDEEDGAFTCVPPYEVAGKDRCCNTLIEAVDPATQACVSLVVKKPVALPGKNPLTIQPGPSAFGAADGGGGCSLVVRP